MVTAERVIHTTIFALLLIGLCALTGWVSYQYITEFVLKLAAITLSWGVILVSLYVGFKKLDWRWWG